MDFSGPIATAMMLMVALGELGGVRDEVLLHLLDEAEVALPDPGLVLWRHAW